MARWRVVLEVVGEFPDAHAARMEGFRLYGGRLVRVVIAGLGRDWRGGGPDGAQPTAAPVRGPGHGGGMSRAGWGLVIALVLVVGVGWWTGQRQADVLARADSLAVVATHQRGQAEAWRALFTEAQTRIDTVVAVRRVRDRVTDTLVQVVREQPVPEGCEAVVAAHREVIDSLVVSRDDWRDQFTAQREAASRLAVAYDTLDSAYRHMQDAYHLIKNPPRRIQIAPAAFAGLCTDGRPCAGLGLTLRWGH